MPHKMTVRALVCLSSLCLTTAAMSASDIYFSNTLTLYSPIDITMLQGLEFGSIPSGANKQVTISPSDSGAAQFSATGKPNGVIIGSIVEPAVIMTTGAGGSIERISVGAWRFGGDMSSSGQATFNTSGKLSDLRVGATAQVSAANVDGTYTGTGTFRITYL